MGAPRRADPGGEDAHRTARDAERIAESELPDQAWAPVTRCDGDELRGKRREEPHPFHLQSWQRRVLSRIAALSRRHFRGS